MAKLPLPANFQDEMSIYSLLYVPGLPEDADPRYSVEPNIQAMVCVNRNEQWVDIPGKGRMRLYWIMMRQPPIPGKAVPERGFLFFRFMDAQEAQRIQQLGPLGQEAAWKNLHPASMVCYAVVPKRIHTSQEQMFVNALFGALGQQAESNAPKDTWAQELFQLPVEEAPTRMDTDGENAE